jgi:antibiotic biosynthesis monooxygenase (ABM) superfamily enzyme
MLLMTLAAWPVAFVAVLTLLTLLGDELQSLPLTLRALVISGVLVSLMANLVMPVLNTAIGRWLSSGPTTVPAREQRSALGAARARREFET